jgi:hypothetical protein
MAWYFCSSCSVVSHLSSVGGEGWEVEVEGVAGEGDDDDPAAGDEDEDDKVVANDEEEAAELDAMFSDWNQRILDSSVE